MAASASEMFLKDPSLGLLMRLRKAELITVAGYYNLAVEDNALKADIL